VRDEPAGPVGDLHPADTSTADLGALMELMDHPGGMPAELPDDDGANPRPPQARIPHEPPADPVRPSTSRPEFTALLEQLRAGTRQAADVAAPQRAGFVPAKLRPAEYHSATPDAQPQHWPAPAASAPSVLARQRRELRRLGVPSSLVQELPDGDRFAGVLQVLAGLPEPQIDADSRLLAVVGPAGTARMEAHRVALDLAGDDGPRTVVTVPAADGPARWSALAATAGPGEVVAAVEEGPTAEATATTLRLLGADAVIAVIDAAEPLDTSARRIAALGRVDALTVEGAAEVSDPAAVLGLGLPVVRLDGIPIDRVTWTALICARLEGGTSL
jgi:hypothetical protein